MGHNEIKIEYERYDFIAEDEDSPNYNDRLNDELRGQID
jgi:hypothetical protein